jgi:probable rRNA maturation factor
MPEAARRSRPKSKANSKPKTESKAKAKSKAAALAVDVDVRAPQWKKALPGAAQLCRRAARAAFLADRSKRRGSTGPIEAGIVLAGDAFVRRLNRDFRGQDKPTNVLAFPVAGGSTESAPPGAPRLLGDVVVAYGTAAREAGREGKPLADHLCHLVVHGMLHLMGHDHHTKTAAAAMEKREIDVLSGLGVGNPYIDDRPARAGR